ncbi:MAG: hypothetical protein ACO1NX_02900 [Chitinophagaceae bacterium]
MSAQKDSGGVYLTYADYMAKKLSYGNQCNSLTESVTIALVHRGKDFLLKVEHSGINGYHFFQLNANTVFGYKDCNGKTYRVAENKTYEWLNQQEKVGIYIIEPRSGISQTITADRYFFSTHPEGFLIPLTIKNVKAFLFQNQDPQWVQDRFKTQNDLAAWDDNQKMYKLNLVLKELNR